MRHRECLVFVEVRVRRKSRWSTAAESVGPQKQRKLMRAAEIFASGRPGMADIPMRFDVVAIDTGDGNAKLTWIEDAFRPGW